MLEGKELEGKIGEVGGYYVDVDVKGRVEIAVTVEKSFEGGKASSVTKVEVQLLDILQAAAKKTSATWDDTVIAQIKALLGLVG